MSYHHAVLGPEGDGTDLWGSAEYQPIHKQTALAEHVLQGFENPPQLAELENDDPSDDEPIGFALEPAQISAEDVWEHKMFERDVAERFALDENDSATPEEVEDYMSRVSGTDVGFIGLRRARAESDMWVCHAFPTDRSWKGFRNNQCHTIFNRKDCTKE